MKLSSFCTAINLLANHLISATRLKRSRARDEVAREGMGATRQPPNLGNETETYETYFVPLRQGLDVTRQPPNLGNETETENACYSHRNSPCSPTT